MAAIDTNTEHTLLEVAKRHDPTGKMAAIVDVLSQKNPMLEEGAWIEGNDFTSHTISQVNTEPSGSWVGALEEVTYESPTVKQVKEDIFILASMNKIPLRVLGKARNPREYRRRNDEIHLRGLAKAFHNAAIYGNTGSDPRKPNGFLTRYNNNTTWGGINTLLAGGSGNDVTSIILIKWGEDGVTFCYPRDGKDIIKVRDRGEQLIGNSNQGLVYAVTEFEMQFGICVADHRAIQMIRNVEAAGGNNSWSANQVIQALNRFPDLDNVVMYVNRDVKTQMDQDAQNKTNVNLTIGEAWGRPTTFFQGIPVRLCEQIISTETAIS